MLKIHKASEWQELKTGDKDRKNTTKKLSPKVAEEKEQDGSLL